MADRVFSPEYRVSVVERMLNGESASALSSELKIRRSVLYRWRDRYRKEGAEGLKRANGRPPGQVSGGGQGKSAQEAAAGRVAELERRLGQLALENDFLRRAFKRVEESRRKSGKDGVKASTERSGK